jgi:NhaP-type Na+/H+ or K+/H+ antiporter
VNLFLAGALSAEALAHQSLAGAVVDLFGGAGIGLAIGLVGALLLTTAKRARWSDPAFQPLAVAALSIVAYALALEAGTNGFVAAFVAGMTYGSATPGREKGLSLTEDVGELLSLAVWFIFGAVMLVPGLKAASWRDIVFAVAALTFVRMVPVALSLIGSGLDSATVAFIGWFGPRGLASVVFGLIAADTLDAGAANAVLAATVVVVALSVAAHGISASPLARRYGDRTDRLERAAPEHSSSPAIRSRAYRGTLIRGRGSSRAA